MRNFYGCYRGCWLDAKYAKCGLTQSERYYAKLSCILPGNPTWRKILYKLWGILYIVGFVCGRLLFVDFAESCNLVESYLISYQPPTRKNTASECVLSVLSRRAKPDSRGSLYGLKLPVLGI